jgi:hypothetical protein
MRAVRNATTNPHRPSGLAARQTQNDQSGDCDMSETLEELPKPTKPNQGSVLLRR